MNISHTSDSNTIQASWIVRLHPGLFGIALGLLALAGSWLKLSALVFYSTYQVGLGLLIAGTAILVLLLMLYMVKIFLVPGKIVQEFLHPGLGAILALIPVSSLLFCILLLSIYPQAKVVCFYIILVSLAIQGMIAWRIVSLLSTGQISSEWISPTLYLPIVPGGFVGAMALNAIELPGFAMLLFGMGLGGWALLEIRILHRLFSGALPLALRPTLGIEIAPAAVGTLAAVTLWPELSGNLIMIALGIASGPIFAVLTRWRWWTQTPFSFGFWSFSFPLAAIATSVVEAVRRAGWPVEVAFITVMLVSTVVFYLSLRTLVQLFSGRLLSQ
jgi:tellurite resistance protein